MKHGTFSRASPCIPFQSGCPAGSDDDPEEEDDDHKEEDDFEHDHQRRGLRLRVCVCGQRREGRPRMSPGREEPNEREEEGQTRPISQEDLYCSKRYREVSESFPTS
ncbi:hypothetical protein Pcinc_024049 [Petrolisthes cinctipes]|uniref:Uncharacterized protein n=1 Tax=Petrolisthes cinctipes TaxID=88211 RepID=A0AAE1KEY5_PETCI|nr:hypothetical protein Pcinc_024049 [Petrolisthes cinctipes]